MPHEGGAALAWSERGGLFVRRLDARGAPRGEPVRVGAPCPGGVALDADGGALHVACVRPGDADRGRDGYVALFGVRVGEGTPSATLTSRTGPVGPDSHGVDLVVRGERAVVGWRSADTFAARAFVADGPLGDLPPGFPISTSETIASAPSLHLAAADDARVVAWTESWLERGRQGGHLLVQRGQEPPRPSLAVRELGARVHLVADEAGPMVTVRDLRSSRHRAFVGRLDERLRLREDALESPGRADGEDITPMLVPCGEHVFAVMARRSSREVTMVNLRRLDADLSPVEAEQQIYEYHARFPQAVGACVDGALLVAVGERQSDAQEPPVLRTFRLRCGPGVRHERTPSLEGNAAR